MQEEGNRAFPNIIKEGTIMRTLINLFVAVICKALAWACNHPLMAAVFSAVVIIGLHAAEGLMVRVPDSAVHQFIVTDDVIDGVYYTHTEYCISLFGWAGDTVCEEDLD